MADPNTMGQSMATMDQSGIPCCPPLKPDDVCDILDFHYRLIENTTVVSENQSQIVQVEIKIHTRLERCPGPLSLGDPVYSTTLLPGEKVRLFTADRRSRFTFDSSTKVSYRNEQTSEEQFYMASMSDFMSDVSTRDSSNATSSSSGSAQGHAGTSGAIETFFSGASVDVSGSYNASSTSDFLRETSAHASASSHRAEMGTRTASSVSVGEVQTRTHTQGESEDHFESSSREFSNPNKCHAITFFFYRINKLQTLKFTLESIERRVIEPAGDPKVTNNPFLSSGGVSTIPNGVLATDKQRLDIENIGRTSIAAKAVAPTSFAVGQQIAAVRVQPITTSPPLPLPVREKALLQVDQELVKVGLLDKPGGKVSSTKQEEVSFERHFSLPTPGIIVKGCLDDCDVCEPTLSREIELDLARKALENDLLKKQIELLEKSQEYRCCPEDTDKP